MMLRLYDDCGVNPLGGCAQSHSIRDPNARNTRHNKLHFGWVCQVHSFSAAVSHLYWALPLNPEAVADKSEVPGCCKCGNHMICQKSA